MSDLRAAARRGARNCVVDWTRVQPGEEVLIMQAGEGVEPDVVATFTEVLREVGARPTLVACDLFNPRGEDPAPPAAEALKGADVCFFFSPFPPLIHSRAGRRAMMEYGMRNVPVLANTLEQLASPWAQFPVRLLLELHERCWRIVRGAREVRVTSRSGTDLRGRLPVAVASADRSVNVAGLGWHGIWPGECGPCLEPMESMEGTIVVDVLPGFQGYLDEKIRVTVRDNRIVRIEGGREADWFRDFVERSLAEGSDADVLHELQWGLNPKGDVGHALLTTDRDEVEISRIARTAHFGFGSGTRNFHWDVVLVDGFDLRIGDEAVYRDGRLTLLDDPEVRELAAGFGDPDRILKEESGIR